MTTCARGENGRLPGVAQKNAFAGLHASRNKWKFDHLQRVRRADCRRKCFLQKKQKGESA